MGSIKDIIDLAKDLESRAKDRKDIETLRSIVSLVQSIQMEHSEVIDRDFLLMEENSRLKRELSEAQAEETYIHKGIEFRRGKRTRNKWAGFCPKCHLPVQDAWYPRGNGNIKVILCTGKCGCEVFMDSMLQDIASELDL